VSASDGAVASLRGWGQIHTLKMGPQLDRGTVARLHRLSPKASSPAHHRQQRPTSSLAAAVAAAYTAATGLGKTALQESGP
jgi:hypothetical protein